MPTHCPRYSLSLLIKCVVLLGLHACVYQTQETKPTAVARLKRPAGYCIQSVLDEVAAEFTPKMNARFAKMESEARVTLTKEHGIKLKDAPTSAISDAVATMTPYWEEWAKEHNTEAAMSAIRAKLGR